MRLLDHALALAQRLAQVLLLLHAARIQFPVRLPNEHHLSRLTSLQPSDASPQSSDVDGLCLASRCEGPGTRVTSAKVCGAGGASSERSWGE